MKYLQTCLVLLNIAVGYQIANLAGGPSFIPLSDLRDDKVVSFPLIWDKNQLFINLSVGTPPQTPNNHTIMVASWVSELVILSN